MILKGLGSTDFLPQISIAPADLHKFSVDDSDCFSSSSLETRGGVGEERFRGLDVDTSDEGSSESESTCHARIHTNCSEGRSICAEQASAKPTQSALLEGKRERKVPASENFLTPSAVWNSQ
eukprot:Trichotokara_eunicae@DN6179_c0_g2_i3.p1